MSRIDNQVRTHTHASNRAKRQEGTERKVVFKSALGNPFRVQWPSVPINLQNTFLARVISIVDGLSERLRSRNRRDRYKIFIGIKQSSAREQTERPKKRRKLSKEIRNKEVEAEQDVAPNASSSSPDQSNEGEKLHDILSHLTIGINEVTRRLETQIRDSRRIATVSGSDITAPPSDPRPAIKLIFVCRADVDPPLLIAHLPYLVAAYNSSLLSCTSQGPDLIKLVPLPKGAELALAEAIGIRRAAVLAIDCNAPELSTFSPFLDSVPTLSAAWLTPQTAPQSNLVPTHIKQIRTSAPKDMKAVKSRRVQERRAAKRRKKDSRASGKDGEMVPEPGRPT